MENARNRNVAMDGLVRVTLQMHFEHPKRKKLVHLDWSDIIRHNIRPMMISFRNFEDALQPKKCKYRAGPLSDWSFSVIVLMCV